MLNNYKKNDIEKNIINFNNNKNSLLKLIGLKSNNIPDIPLDMSDTDELLKIIKNLKYILNNLKKEINKDSKIYVNTHKYMAQFNNQDNLFWGIGLENECYLQGVSKKVLGKDIINMLGRERYSVDYTLNYKLDDIKKIMSKIYEHNKTYNISQMINAHSFDKMDRFGEHLTTYQKEPQDNIKFSGKTVLEEWFCFDEEIKNKINAKSKTETNIFFDGDTIEFITEKFYKTNSQDTVLELMELKKWFIEKFNIFKKNTKLWEELGEINYVLTHPGLNIFKSMPEKIVFFNNSTIHIHITLPTKIINNIICNKENFYNVHAKAIKLLQWFEPFFICTLGSPDILQFVYKKHFNSKNNYFAKGSMRATLSRYIGVGTYDTHTLKDGKKLTAPINNFRPNKIKWWRDMIQEKLLYNLPENDMGYDFNFAKHYQSGLEFRLLDGIPLNILKDVIDVIILICEHSYSYVNLVDIDLCSDSQSWNNIVFKSMIDGYEAVINKEEISEYIKVLKIDYSIDENELLLEDFYYIILEHLFKIYKNKDTSVIKYMTKDFNKINRWENFNKVQSIKHIESLEEVH